MGVTERDDSVAGDEDASDEEDDEEGADDLACWVLWVASLLGADSSATSPVPL